MAPIPQLLSSILAMASSALNTATGTTPTTQTLDSDIGNNLPLPPSSTPLYIAVGLGTQNYTCSASGATPTAVGAYARLFSASSTSTLMLANITSTYVQAYQSAQQTLGCSAGPLSCADTVNLLALPRLGEHFFTDSTPTFHLDGSAVQNPNVLFATVENKASPPSNAYAGANQAGAVQWLYLGNDGSGRTTSAANYVYRVETAAGTAPTCTQAGDVQIPYSAQYWFYA